MAATKALQEGAAQQAAPRDTGKAPTYTVDEFAQAADAMGATPDIIRAAFLMAGRAEATEEEAKKLIERFKKKEVR